MFTLATAAVVLIVTGCGSDDDIAAAPAPTSAPAATSSTTAPSAASMRGQRYCEVLLVRPDDGTITAEVYNSWTLNDCPPEQWARLDAVTIAAEHGAATALLNGPRYWLMDAVDKQDRDAVLETRTAFGEIDMYRLATVEIGPLADAMRPYTPRSVDRRATFRFDAGRTVYELTAADGSTYVMQTWSQMIDPNLAEGDLEGLATRLTLPDGWTYSARRLTEPLVLDTTDSDALVLQDDLRNSYSLVTAS